MLLQLPIGFHESFYVEWYVGLDAAGGARHITQSEKVIFIGNKTTSLCDWL